MKMHQSGLALVGFMSVSVASAWANHVPFYLAANSNVAAAHLHTVSLAHGKQRRQNTTIRTARRSVYPKGLFSASESSSSSNQQQTTKEKISAVSTAATAAVSAAIPQGVSASLPTIASVLAATVGTFVLNNSLNLGPVKASSLVGLVSTLILPLPLAIAAFCGGFAGMATTNVIPGLGASSVLGLVCAAMITLFDRQKWLLGVGGRLGFIAQCSCTAQFLMASLLFGAPPAPAALVGSTPLNFSKLATQLPMVASLTVAGALAMRYWKHLVADKSVRLTNVVGSVSVVGLASGLALPPAMAGPIFCGTFVAMAAPTKLPTLMSLVWASILAGAAQQSLAGVMLGGWGGKLGTAALMGVLAYRGLVKMVPDEKLETKMGINNMKVPR